MSTVDKSLQRACPSCALGLLIWKELCVPCRSKQDTARSCGLSVYATPSLYPAGLTDRPCPQAPLCWAPQQCDNVAPTRASIHPTPPNRKRLLKKRSFEILVCATPSLYPAGLTNRPCPQAPLFWASQQGDNVALQVKDFDPSCYVHCFSFGLWVAASRQLPFPALWPNLKLASASESWHDRHSNALQALDSTQWLAIGACGKLP